VLPRHCTDPAQIPYNGPDVLVSHPGLDGAARRSNDTLLAEGDAVELVEHRLVEALADAVAGSWFWCGAANPCSDLVEVAPVGVDWVVGLFVGSVVGGHHSGSRDGLWLARLRIQFLYKPLLLSRH
jgi:hypothetical protein